MSDLETMAGGKQDESEEYTVLDPVAFESHPAIPVGVTPEEYLNCLGFDPVDYCDGWNDCLEFLTSNGYKIVRMKRDLN